MINQNLILEKQKLDKLYNDRIKPHKFKTAPSSINNKIQSLTEPLNTKESVVLEEVEHVYEIRDEKYKQYTPHMISATRLLGLVFNKQFDKVDETTLKNAQDLGSFVHKTIEDFYTNGMKFDIDLEKYKILNGYEEQVENSLKAFTNFHNELMRILEKEEKVIGEPTFKMETPFYCPKSLVVGTCDFIITYLSGAGETPKLKRWILDFKTTSVRKDITHLAQLRLYHYLLNNLIKRRGAETIADEDYRHSTVYISKKERLDRFKIWESDFLFNKEELRELMYFRFAELKYQLKTEKQIKEMTNPNVENKKLKVTPVDTLLRQRAKIMNELSIMNINEKEQKEDEIKLNEAKLKKIDDKIRIQTGKEPTQEQLLRYYGSNLNIPEVKNICSEVYFNHICKNPNLDDFLENPEKDIDWEPLEIEWDVNQIKEVLTALIIKRKFGKGQTTPDLQKIDVVDFLDKAFKNITSTKNKKLTVIPNTGELDLQNLELKGVIDDIFGKNNERNMFSPKIVKYNEKVKEIKKSNTLKEIKR